MLAEYGELENREKSWLFNQETIHKINRISPLTTASFSELHHMEG